MRKFFGGMTLLAVIMLAGCQDESAGTSKTDELSGITVKDPGLRGTWKLISGTLIEKGDTTTTDYTTGKSFIKIINDTHFRFFTARPQAGQGFIRRVFIRWWKI